MDAEEGKEHLAEKFFCDKFLTLFLRINNGDLGFFFFLYLKLVQFLAMHTS